MKKTLCCLLPALFYFLSTALGQEMQGHITVDGLDRSFIIYLPKASISTNGDPTRPFPAAKLPLLLVLHGRFGDPKGTIRLADFRPIADREKVILVYPAGIDHSWNDGRLKTPAHEKNINDVGFLSELMTYLIRHYPVDSSRIYVTGMSNGGFMTSRLGCALSGRLAAIAIVAASMGQDSPCRPEAIPPGTAPSETFLRGASLSVLYMQGTKDPLVPFNGGEMQKGAGGMIDSHREVLDRWIAMDGCANRPVVTHWPDSAGDGTAITKEEYTNQANGIKVVGYTIEGGGHAWPGGWAYLPKMFIGVTSKNLNACEAIWAFFKSVPALRQ